MANERWQYQVVEMKPKWLGVPAEAVQSELNKLGQIGWELVNVMQVNSTLRLFLKRQV